jgi:predicted NACHT family NTPase
MKQRTDALVASDEKLQQFLMWVSQKSLSVKVPYKPAAVRAFYFSLERGLDPALERSLDRTLNRAFDRAPDLVLDRTLERALARVIERALDRALDGAIERALNRALNLAVEPQLRQALQELKAQLPDSDGDEEIFKQWWQTNGKAWTEQLRAVMIKHRNLGHDWQFSYQQRKVLQQYYEANLLLIDCLNSASNVNPAVREEIEQTLLLPIALIEKRRSCQDR